MIQDIGRGGVFNWPHVPHKCSYVCSYMLMAFVDMNIAHIAYTYMYHTQYTPWGIGRKHDIGRCPPTVNRCMYFVYMQYISIICIYTNVCKSE